MKKKILFLTTCLLFIHPVFAEVNDSNFNPVGDGTNVEIFKFIGEEILNKKLLTTVELKNLKDEETKNYSHPNSDKPYIADMSEGEIAHLLAIICRENPRCYNITLYGKDGVGIATSGLDAVLQKKKLNKRDDGFYIGILNSDILLDSKSRNYISEDGKEYSEYLKPIAMKEESGGGRYFVFAESGGNDAIIGYISWIQGTYKKPSY